MAKAPFALRSLRSPEVKECGGGGQPGPEQPLSECNCHLRRAVHVEELEPRPQAEAPSMSPSG